MKAKLFFAIILALTLVLAVCPVSVAAAEDVCFICDDGADYKDGKTPDSPKATLDAAYAALPNGGTIVFCGDFTLLNSHGANYVSPESEATYTFTTTWDGVDYAATNGGNLGVNCWFTFNAPHIFKDLQINVMKNT